MNAKKKNRIYPFFLSLTGCPFRCIYCDQTKTAPSVDPPTPSSVTAELDEAIEPPNGWVVAFYGGTFTGMDVALQQDYLNAIWQSDKASLIDSIRISTHPARLDKDDVSRLRENGVRTIELGVQSFDDEVLKASTRSYTETQVNIISNIIRETSITLGIQLMPGLPREVRKSWEQTVNKTIEAKPDFVRIYPTLVIKNTPLEAMYHNGEYKPLSLEDAVDYCSFAQLEFDRVNIRVERVGLAQIVGLADNVIAGPYHPAFGELTLSRIMQQQIEDAILQVENISQTDNTIQIETASCSISSAIGHNKSNIKYFKEQMGINLRITPNPSLKRFQVRVTSSTLGAS